jgi:regulator of sigma E protease
MEFVSQYLTFGWDGLIGFVIPFIIVLSVLVFVHEWGHYIVARMCGVRVEKFSIGFGKELFGFTDKAGTRWKISIIPLGGYVQMFGDQDPASAKKTDEIKDGDAKRTMNAEERKVAFFSKPVWKRAAIVFAGPAINFIFAILLLAGLYMSVGKPVNPPVASAIIVDGAADVAGMKPNDRVIAIDGKAIESFTDIQRQVVISLDRALDLTVLRDGEEVQVNVTPKKESLEDRFGFSHSRGLIGIMGTEKGMDLASVKTINNRDVSSLSPQNIEKRLKKIVGRDAVIGLPSGVDDIQNVRVNIANINEGQIFLSEIVEKEIVTYGVVQSVGEAVQETWFIVAGTLEAIGQIFTGTRPVTELGGIVRIGAIAGDAAQNGLIALISFTAMLSINLGLINLFPIPLLDGGHLVFYAYEAVFGKPMPERVMDYAFKFGMAFLICLMAFSNLNDIVQMIL